VVVAGVAAPSPDARGRTRSFNCFSLIFLGRRKIAEQSTGGNVAVKITDFNQSR
jgi:hypothetical protein